MSAPRIDTFRNLIASLVDKLQELDPDIADLHDLAYNRHRAANEAKVKGGTRDYALDTHGDLRARDLYTKTAARLVGLGREAEKDLKDIRRYLNATDRAIRLDHTADVTATEFDQAHNARTRRLARGERHPHLLVSQPERRHHIDPTVELEQLRGAVRRLAAHLDQEHRDCTHAPDEHGRRRRKRRWFARDLLGPAQRDAMDRALSDLTGQQAS